MDQLHCILFEERTADRLPGFSPEVRITDLPLWANFTVKGVLEASRIHTLPCSFLSPETIHTPEGIKNTTCRLEKASFLLIGRTSNIVAADWQSIQEMLRGRKEVIKIQVGGVPSELYGMSVKQFEEMLFICMKKISKQHREGYFGGIASYNKTSGYADHIHSQCLQGQFFLRYLFEEVLFSNFEKLVDAGGFSFLLRNCYEFYMENLNLINYLKDRAFIAFYNNLKTVTSSSIKVTESARVKNSILGGGAVVEGEVEDSIIFSDVVVERGAAVKNSVILPSNYIEQEVQITHALVLQGENRRIHKGSVIGNRLDVANTAYPHSIKRGLCVIGEKPNIPEQSSIGAGCFVYSEHPGQPDRVVMEDGETRKLS